MISYYLAAIVLVFLQAVLGGVLAPLPVILVASQRKTEAAGQVYLLAFVSGILVDLVTGRLVGETAVFLLVTTLVSEVLTVHFRRGWRVAVLVGVVSELGYYLLVTRFGF